MQLVSSKCLSHMESEFKRGQKEAAAKAKAMARITTGKDYKVCADCHLVVEAATEDETVKKAIVS